MRIATTLFSGLLVMSLAGLALASEEKIEIAKLPAKVSETVKAKFPGTDFTDAAKETDNGKTFFEVTVKVNGQKIDVTCEEDGTLVSIEKSIAEKDLPQTVRDALKAKYAGSSHEVIEEITKGTDVSYEVLLVTADKKKLEVKFDKEGKVLNEEKKSDKD